MKNKYHSVEFSLFHWNFPVFKSLKAWFWSWGNDSIENISTIFIQLFSIKLFPNLLKCGKFSPKLGIFTAKVFSWHFLSQFFVIWWKILFLLPLIIFSINLNSLLLKLIIKLKIGSKSNNNFAVISIKIRV